MFNDKLSFALKRHADFTAEDIDAFELGELRTDHYIKSTKCGGGAVQNARRAEALADRKGGQACDRGGWRRRGCGQER
eukprot:4938845-Prymnesium_polylepis.1